MSPLLTRNRLRGSSGTGVLAGRALLVVTEYLHHHELPEDGREILSRFRSRFDEARDEGSRPGLRAVGAASVDVVQASERALRSLTRGEESSAEATLEEVLGILDELRTVGQVAEDQAILLRDFLDRYSAATLDQGTPGIMFGRASW